MVFQAQAFLNRFTWYQHHTITSELWTDRHKNILSHETNRRKQVIVENGWSYDTINVLVLSFFQAECVFTRSIESLCSNVHSTQYRSEIGTMKGYTMPVYTGGQYRIWGLTAIFTHQLLSLLIPELYQFKIKHRWRRSEDWSWRWSRVKIITRLIFFTWWYNVINNGTAMLSSSVYKMYANTVEPV